MADNVTEHRQAHRLRPDDLLWSAPERGPLSYTNFRQRVWRPAVVASGLDPALRFHDLWMGNSTIKVTFDRYGHLFPHELEDLAASLSDFRRSPEHWGTGRATVGDRGRHGSWLL